MRRRALCAPAGNPARLGIKRRGFGVGGRVDLAIVTGSARAERTEGVEPGLAPQVVQSAWARPAPSSTWRRRCNLRHGGLLHPCWPRACHAWESARDRAHVPLHVHGHGHEPLMQQGGQWLGVQPGPAACPGGGFRSPASRWRSCPVQGARGPTPKSNRLEQHSSFFQLSTGHP